MDKAAFLDELNVRTGDSDNFTFTEEEKNSAITRAMNDDHVVNEVWDSSLVYSSGTYEYAYPAGVSVVNDILYQSSTYENPNPIDSDMWTTVDGSIHFRGRNTFSDGTGLLVRGLYKYTDTDTINETNLKEYVLANAQLILYTTLLNKRNFRFLKNDTTVSEIVATKRELEREVADYRRKLPKYYVPG